MSNNNPLLSSALRCIVTLGTALGLIGSAGAVGCDPHAEGSFGCAPINTHPTFWFDQNRSGVLVIWQLYDEPLPDTVRVYRQPPMNAAGYLDIPGDSPSFFDAGVVAGRSYSYLVCAQYDTPGCSGWVTQGVPSDGGGGGTVSPTAPSSLQVKDISTWISPTRWQQRIALSWRPGNAYESTVINTGNVLGIVELPQPTAASYVFTSGVTWGDPFQFKACGATRAKGIWIGPNGTALCSNSVSFNAGPRPVPKAPVGAGATALSQDKIDVQFSSGDENVSTWFDVQRLNGPNNGWLTLKPRVAAGSAGLVVDDGSNATPGFGNPFTYRVCAGNESGMTCTDRFKAKTGVVPVVQQFRLTGLAGKCMNAESDGMNVPNGTAVTLYTCMNGFDGRPLSVQIWSRNQGAASPVAGVGGRCLDVTGNNPRSGTPVELWDCNGGANQSWTPAPDGTLRGLAGKCLDVAGGNANDGTHLILWDCTGAPNQQWRLELVAL